jgi:hypothetical protein
LRVLGEQTLEINKGVKDSPVLDPSLAKEVEDPSLTILFSHRWFIQGRERRSAPVRVFQQEGAPLEEEKFDLKKEKGFGGESYWEMIVGPRAPFLAQIWRVLPAYQLFGSLA